MGRRGGIGRKTRSTAQLIPRGILKHESEHSSTLAELQQEGSGLAIYGGGEPMAN